MAKKRSKTDREDIDIEKMVNEVGYEVEKVLKSHNEEKYFEEIIVLYNLIENLLKYSVFLKIFREKINEEGLSREELLKMSGFCWRLGFHDALNIGLCVGVIEFGLYKRIEKVKKERNDVIHQLWIYEHRRDAVELRGRLEMLARVEKQVAGITAQLAAEITAEGLVERLLKIR